MTHAVLPDGLLEAKVQPNRIKELPLFREDKRTIQKDRLETEVAAATKKWLKSEQGQMHLSFK